MGVVYAAQELPSLIQTFRGDDSVFPWRSNGEVRSGSALCAAAIKWDTLRLVSRFGSFSESARFFSVDIN